MDNLESACPRFICGLGFLDGVKFRLTIGATNDQQEVVFRGREHLTLNVDGLSTFELHCVNLQHLGNRKLLSFILTRKQVVLLVGKDWNSGGKKWPPVGVVGFERKSIILNLYHSRL